MSVTMSMQTMEYQYSQKLDSTNKAEQTTTNDAKESTFSKMLEDKHQGVENSLEENTEVEAEAMAEVISWIDPRMLMQEMDSKVYGKLVLPSEVFGGKAENEKQIESVIATDVKAEESQVTSKHSEEAKNLSFQDVSLEQGTQGARVDAEVAEQLMVAEEQPKGNQEAKVPEVEVNLDASVNSVDLKQAGPIQNMQTSAKNEVPVSSNAQSLEQLNERIVKEILSGREEFEIQLNPRNLGELTVKATFENGQAVISIICSEKDTAQLLAQKAGDLAVIMEQRMGSETQVVVETSQTDYLQQEKEAEQQSKHKQQSQQENESKTYQENSDFLQQLRLGLV